MERSILCLPSLRKSDQSIIKAAKVKENFAILYCVQKCSLVDYLYLPASPSRKFLSKFLSVKSHVVSVCQEVYLKKLHFTNYTIRIYILYRISEKD